MRFFFLVFALLFPCFVLAGDSIRSKASPCEIDEEWCRLEKQHDFPGTFSTHVKDSLHSAKKMPPAKTLRQLPFQQFCHGEKFVFAVNWGPINAGYTILEAKPDSTGSVLEITGKGMTNSFFSSFYKVRDFISATIDMQGIYPFFFEQHIREGKYKAERWEMFDQRNNVTYTYRKDVDSIPCPAFVQNYFSMIYYLRTLSFAPGDSFAFDCFVDKKPYRLVMTCPKRATITVEAGTFNCLMVKPVLVGEGRVFTKKDEILLWFTDDKFKMPVMAKAKIKFGSITGSLIWYDHTGK